MNRLDKLGEILKSYEGRNYDYLALLKDYMSSDAYTILKSLSSELQQKILKYFDCVRRTGLVKWQDSVTKKIESFETTLDLFNNYLTVIGTLTKNELAKISDDLDKRVQWYETEEK